MVGAEALDLSGNGLIIAGVLSVLATACILVVGLVRYRLSRHEFEVLVGNVVIRRIYLYNIDDVFVGSRFPCEFWPSRSLFKGGRLTIRRKKGFPRHLTITPPEPEKLRVNLCYTLGWKP